jgi:uncharacterized protein
MTPGLVLSLLCAVHPVPALAGPVVDEAGIVEATARARLEALARAARALNGGEGVQLQIWTVPSLEDEPIEDLSIRAAEIWKLGSKGKDNGLLLVVARAERKFRLEVGGGLEGDLPDIQAKHLLDATLVPAFRRGDYGGGLYAASVAALDAVHGLPDAFAQDKLRPQRRVPTDDPPVPYILFPFLGLVFLFILIGNLLAYRTYRRTGVWPSGSSSSGSSWSSGSSSSSSGWSGGGGSFSGGGASGGW